MFNGFEMENSEIEHLFDTSEMTLADLSLLTGKTVNELMDILMEVKEAA